MLLRIGCVSTSAVVPGRLQMIASIDVKLELFKTIVTPTMDIF